MLPAAFFVCWLIEPCPACSTASSSAALDDLSPPDARRIV
jgi:hypothetical protein